MPVMFQADQYEQWLTGSEEKALLDLLAPFPDTDLEAYPVDPSVNKPTFNNPTISRFLLSVFWLGIFVSIYPDPRAFFFPFIEIEIYLT